MHSKIISTSILGVLIISVLGNIQLATAQSNETKGSLFGERISGQFTDPQSGLSIDFPKGWSGMLLGRNPIVSPGGIDFLKGSPPVSLTILILDRPTFFNNTSGQNGNATSNCHEISSEYTSLNSMSTLHFIRECNDVNTGYAKSNSYGIMTDKKFVVVSYFANSTQAYDTYLADYTHSLDTLKITGVQDMRSTLASNLHLQTNAYPVRIDGKSYDVKVESSSKISNFNFDQEAKSLSFKAEGAPGTRGTSVVSIGNLLEGPYSVMVDGKAIDNPVVTKDSATGELLVTLGYNQGSHEIAVTGTNVVPEFPTDIAAIVGIVFGALILLSKLKSKGRLS